MTRPDISSITTGEDFKKWYWLKEEVVNYCKAAKIPYSGSKFDIIDRIANVLDNKIDNKIPTDEPSKSDKITPKSSKTILKMNWHTAHLTLDTVITDSYKNGQNVRRFFQEHCGEKFSFNIEFMAWMKKNEGKTLENAVNEWLRIAEQSKDKTFKSIIPEGNQYNKYMRDFFLDNPDKTIQEARHFWQLKRTLPLGLHKYERSDLDLK